jgi:uncharacterized membrane protein YqjE
MNKTTTDNGRRPIGELLRNIGEDVKTIASDEVELARTELTKNIRVAIVEVAIMVIGALVALIGFGFLCVVTVVALEPVIHSLALRLLIMAVLYLVGGGMLAGEFAKRLRKDAVPDLGPVVREAKQTVESVKEGLE